MLNTIRRAALWSESDTIRSEDVREALIPMSLTEKTEVLDFGTHDNPAERQIFPPNTDTANALFFALKDIIGWFGKLSSNQEKSKT